MNSYPRLHGLQIDVKLRKNDDNDILTLQALGTYIGTVIVIISYEKESR